MSSRINPVERVKITIGNFDTSSAKRDKQAAMIRVISKGGRCD